MDIARQNAAESAQAAFGSGDYADWVAHVKTALPQVEAIEVREREDDHHAYFVVRYAGGYEVPSRGLSDGTLRILTLTLLPYLARQPALVVVEEPENGIHPQAITTVMQSLDSFYESQMLVSSHPPLVLAETRLEQLLCAQLAANGCLEKPAVNRTKLTKPGP